MAEERTQRRLSAILAADVAGYSRLMAADEAGTLAALRDVWARRLNPAVAAHRGRIVKMLGDGALIEFASAVDAVECAVAFQEAMAGHNRARPEREPIEFRIGVNLGDIVVDGDDIFGDGVNVAARLEGQAPKTGILVSDAVHAQIMGKVGVVFLDVGALSLKNIETPVRAWRWGGDGLPAQASTKAPTASAEAPSIAVLPFANMSGDPEQDFFADGLVEDICFVLAFAGYPQEAVAHGERAMTLSPNYPAYYLGHVGNAYRLAGRAAEAISAFKAYNARNPGFGLADIVIAYQQTDQPAEATATAQQLLSLRRDFTTASWANTQFFRADRAQLDADIAALRAAGLPVS